MNQLTLKWFGKVLMYAGVAAAILIVNLIWRPVSSTSKDPNQKIISVAIRSYLEACAAGNNDQNIIEVHHCDHGWAVYRGNKTPQVFNEQGEVLCEAKEITDASASDCLRQFSDQVGRCVVECTSVKQ